MKITTDLHLSAVVKNEWNYTFAPPVCFCGVDRYSFTFSTAQMKL